jgi:hypothetical protein
MSNHEPSEPVLLPEDHQSEWAQSTYRIRAAQIVLTRLVDPRPTSALAAADTHYRWEKVSVWSRGYLLAAVDNLSFWADQIAPYDFTPGQVNHVAFRPYLLLGRSALEAVAHGLWLLSATDIDELMQRHVGLMHRDFQYHLKALESGGQDGTRIQKRITALGERAATLNPAPNPKDSPPGYEKLVRLAAVYCQEDENLWAYYWNAASGAAHGQNWFSLEGFELAYKEEYEPGHFRVSSIPDPQFITATIGAATTALDWATLRWLELASYPPELVVAAMHEVHDRMPKKSEHGQR